LQRDTTRRAIEMIGGFETTYLPAHDRDVAETTEHDVRWREDVELMARSGVTRLRLPVRWHRIEATQGIYDWRETDQVLGHLHDRGFRPIVDLVHHTSYPSWLRNGFADARFADAYVRFADAVAQRYPWIPEYTLFNEPFSTLFLSGHEAIWPPYRAGLEGFVELVRNVLPAVTRASRMYRDLLPDARHVYVDTCEQHYGAGVAGSEYAVMANDRRFFVADLFLGRSQDDSAFLPSILEAGGGDLLEIEPGVIDVLGLDYYAHCQWDFPDQGPGSVPASRPVPLSAQITAYWERFGLPCLLSETNIRGYASDRASWLKYTLEQCEIARDAGVPMDGLCWFPFVDSADWGSLLHRCEGSIDPVGVYWLDEHLDRRSSSMSRAYVAAASGVRSADLPAYELREPVATWLRGYRPHMSHWDWQPPPPGEQCSNRTPEDATFELRVVGGA
jgi:beta-glucosidase/6-phospho-beta-glucosidase/beta-galactosidase